MFSPQFADYSMNLEPFSAISIPPGKKTRGGEDRPGEQNRQPADAAETQREAFTTESAEVTLDAVVGANTNDRSVALKLESILGGQVTASDHANDALQAALEDWMRITHHVMDYQYVHDMNSYVKAVQHDERTRLDRQFNTITNDVMIKKHMYMMRQRDADKLYSRVRILLHIMLFISAFAFLYANRAFFGPASWVIIGIMSFAFSIYVIMFIKINSSRRYDDWNKLYFNDDRDIDAEGSAEDLESIQQCEQTGNVPFAT